jgi:FtsP/CotA-like multicopper oxidase with cupredoxin domain
MKHEAHHSHGAHGTMVHEPTAETLAAYQEALRNATPGPGGRVVAVELEARETEWEFVPGRSTRAWTYDGQVPGPLLEARVGDVLEVRLRNSLSEPTMIHWHGIRLPAPMDGTENIQRPVAPGETFTYRFRLPDAGTFWYHPHINETVQLERGLYGALIVRGPDGPQLDREQVLVLDDVALDRDARIEPPGGWIERHDGRQGSTRLVNGRAEPELQMAGGQVERWRVINASSARYIRLSIGGQPFRILGTDGGLINSPVSVSELLLTPGDRADLAVGPFTAGEKVLVESLRYGRGSFRRPKREPFATLLIGPTAPSQAVIPQRLRSIEPLVTGEVSVNREVLLGFKLSPKRGVDFVINKEAHHRAEPVRLGELQVWDIINRTPVDHPFHLHGFFFQVISVNGEPPPFVSWEDTVNVPARGRVRIAWMPDDRPGEWMYHCHILEHHAGGMMAHFEVVGRAEP